MDILSALAAAELRDEKYQLDPPFPVAVSVDEWTSRLRRMIGQGLCIELDARERTFPITEAEMTNVVVPLCAWLRWLVESKTGGSEGCILVGIAGPAGAGKSVLSQVLKLACNHLWEAPGGWGWAQTLSMDGYVLPNSYLETHTMDDSKSETYTLKQLKGMPSTHDVAALRADLERLRRGGAEEVSLPVYDRNLHDPVPGGVTVRPQYHRLVLVEGLHLLHSEGGWDGIQAAFDRTLFLDVTRDLCFNRVVERKVSNGRPRDSCVEHFHRVDGPIFDQLQAEKHRASVLLALDPMQGRPLQVRGVETQVPLGRAAGALPWEAPGGYADLKFLVVGLNGALQKWVGLRGGLKVGSVNRAAASATGIGGKGQNACVALSRLLADPAGIHLVQFSGGRSGAVVDALLLLHGFRLITGATAAELRTCTTLSNEATGETTEIVEPWGGDISSAEAQALLDRVSEELRGLGPVGGVAFAGSLPGGLGDEFYTRLLKRMAASPAFAGTPPRGCAPVLVDSVHGLPDLLGSGKVGMLKVNGKELVRVGLGADVAERVAWGDGLPNDGFAKEAAARLARKYPGLRWIAATNGPSHGLLFSCGGGSSGSGADDDPHQAAAAAGGTPGPPVGATPRPPPDEQVSLTYWKYGIPRLPDIVNPIGAGDTVSAVTLFCWAAGAPVPEAFRVGLAAGSASCLSAASADFTLEQVRALREQISVRRVCEVGPFLPDDPEQNGQVAS